MSSIEPYSVDYMLKLTQKLLEMRVITSCVTCSHFDEVKEVCRLVDQRPPATTIAQGCPLWLDL